MGHLGTCSFCSPCGVGRAWLPGSPPPRLRLAPKASPGARGFGRFLWTSKWLDSLRFGCPGGPGLSKSKCLGLKRLDLLSLRIAPTRRKPIPSSPSTKYVSEGGFAQLLAALPSCWRLRPAAGGSAQRPIKDVSEKGSAIRLTKDVSEKGISRRTLFRNVFCARTGARTGARAGARTGGGEGFPCGPA